MLCEHCKKREATVKYVEVINGVKTEHNLCTQCAAHADLGQFSALFEESSRWENFSQDSLEPRRRRKRMKNIPASYARPAEQRMRNL